MWKGDLRNFTGMSDRIAGPSMLALLNAYFETMVGPVLSSGGEVLKFLGDGLLAVFPVEDDEHIGSVATVALAAARQAIAGLEEGNRRSDCLLPVDDGWHPLKPSIAIHQGEVFFGNVGSQERLDFTVIGPAVNETCRV